MKKQAPESEGSEEQTSALVLARELHADHALHPVLMVVRHSLAHPTRWLLRPLVPLLTLQALTLAVVGPDGWTRDLPMVSTFFYLFVGLPLWGPYAVAEHVQRFEDNPSQGMTGWLLEQGRLLLAGVGAILLTLFAVFASVHVLGLLGLGSLASMARSVGWFAGTYLFAHAVLDAVTGELGVVQGLLRGTGRSLRALVGAPFYFLGRLRRGFLGDTAGEGFAPVYLMLTWALTVLGFMAGAFAAGALSGGFGWRRPDMLLTVVAAYGATLGYEVGVGLCTYNYLGLLAERPPSLPAGSPAEDPAALPSA